MSLLCEFLVVILPSIFNDGSQLDNLCESTYFKDRY